jgi:hypothetical protein
LSPYKKILLTVGQIVLGAGRQAGRNRPAK